MKPSTLFIIVLSNGFIVNAVGASTSFQSATFFESKRAAEKVCGNWPGYKKGSVKILPINTTI